MRHTSIKSRIRLPRLAIAGLSATTLAVSGLGLAAVASTVPNSDVLDIEAYEDCVRHIDPWFRQPGFQDELHNEIVKCCNNAGGVWSGGDCAAPPGEAPASRHDPSDIGTETFTPSQPRPIHDPSDIGTETFTPTTSPPPPPTTTTAPPPG